MRLAPDMIRRVEDIASSALYDYEAVGVRVQDVPFAPGPMAHRSHVWDNGDDTGEELPARLVEIAAARADRLRRKGTAWAVVECTETAAALLPLYFRQGFGLRALRPLESLAPCFLLCTGCVPARTAPVWVPLEDRVQLALLLAKGYAALDSRPYGGSLALALYPLKETE